MHAHNSRGHRKIIGGVGALKVGTRPAASSSFTNKYEDCSQQAGIHAWGSDRHSLNIINGPVPQSSYLLVFINQRANCSRKNTPSANFILGPLTGGLSRWDKSGLIPPKNIPPTPTFKFCSPGVQHTVYVVGESLFRNLGYGGLSGAKFFILKGSSRRRIFLFSGSLRREIEKFFHIS